MKRRFSKNVVWGGLSCLFVLALGTVLAADDPPRFGPWEAPVNLGPPVDTAENAEFQVDISADGLSLYFVLLPATGDPNTGIDIWAAHRPTRHDPWGAPAKLPDTINTTANSVTPFLTVDGHFLYFASNRKTPDKNGVAPFGKNDIYVARRLNNREDFGPYGWQAAENLGSGVNTKDREGGPFLFEDGVTGVITLYFQSDRPGGPGGMDIYAATLQPDGTFGAVAPVTEVNSAYNDTGVTVSRDGLEMYFISDRPGSTPYPSNGCCGPAGQPSPDIWVSTRASTSDHWAPPQNVDVVNQAMGGTTINSPFDDGRPSLSLDGRSLYFDSPYRQGNQSIYFDIWKTTRHQIKGHHDEDSDNDRDRADDSRDDGGYPGRNRH